MNQFAKMVSLAIALTAVSWNVHAYQTHEEITSGDFESGRVLWMTTNDAGKSATSAGMIQNSAKSYGGSWYGYVGDLSASTFNAGGALFQYIAFTNTTTNLDVSFYLNISSAETRNTAYDHMYVFLKQFDQSGNLTKIDLVASFSNVDKTNGTGSAYYSFKKYHVPISSPGKFQAIVFEVDTDGSNYTTFRIDNVSAVSYFPDPVVNYTVHSFIENGNGSMSPTGNTSVVSGGSISFSATPNSDWNVGNWKVNGSISQIGGSSFSVNNVTANTDISVSFVQVLHQLNVNVVSGPSSGSYTLSPSGGWYTNGTPVTLTAIPSSGYQFSEWNGATYSRENQITYNMSAVGALGLGSLGKSGPMALGDPTINLSFISIDNFCRYSGLCTPAGSKPTITLTPVQDWVTVVESCDDLNIKVWKPLTTISGNYNFTFPPMGNQGFVRGRPCPVVNTPPFMKFPIHDSELPHTWLTAWVTAIMDHNPPDREAANTNAPFGYITTYLGNTFIVNNPADGYADIGDNPYRQLEFYYTGVTYQNGASSLQYDNHQGYDYYFITGTNVYPVYGGETVTDDDDFVKNSNWPGIPSKYMDKYHAIIIRHKNSDGAYMGFCTIYMHLSDVYPDYVDKTDPNSWKPKKHSVDINTPIGKVGNFNKYYPNMGQHLHFGVWMLIKDNTWITVDPYGKQAIDGNRIYPPLWTN